VDAIAGKGGRAAAKVETRDFLALLAVLGDELDLFDEVVDVIVANFLVVEDFAVGTKATDLTAEGDVDVESELLAALVVEFLIVAFAKLKGLDGAQQPHARGIGKPGHCNDI